MFTDTSLCSLLLKNVAVIRIHASLPLKSSLTTKRALWYSTLTTGVYCLGRHIMVVQVVCIRVQRN